MEETERLIKEYLQQGKMMQIATVRDDQPWICTVYFAADDKQHLYWLSLPTRRHSEEIAKHDKVAVAIPIKFDKPVVGMQAQGTAEVVTDADEIKRAMKFYVDKYDIGKEFYDKIIAGENQHHLYRFTPKLFVLFDEVHYDKAESRKEWIWA
jgi:uncharacterized protein YhbP (UPF0306 family)